MCTLSMQWLLSLVDIQHPLLIQVNSNGGSMNHTMTRSNAKQHGVSERLKPIVLLDTCTRPPSLLITGWMHHFLLSFSCQKKDFSCCFFPLNNWTEEKRFQCSSKLTGGEGYVEGRGNKKTHIPFAQKEVWLSRNDTFCFLSALLATNPWLGQERNTTTTLSWSMSWPQNRQTRPFPRSFKCRNTFML